MESKGFGNEFKAAIKTEIIHFTDVQGVFDFEAVKVSKNDNVYGIAWGRLVRDYLKSAYSGEVAEAEVVSEGVTYKVLKRGEVTAFYDADGNTLFDVVNERLEKEYDRLMNDSAEAGAEITEAEMGDEAAAREESIDKEKEADDDVIFMGTTSVAEAAMGLPAPTEEEIKAAIEENAKPAKEKAREKLELEREKAIEEEKKERRPPFAEPVIGYLLERCKEDKGLAEDVVQEHKTWQKCADYIYCRARKQVTGEYAFICDDVVFEWAEDYYHKDDKAEEEEKAREAAEQAECDKKAAQRKKGSKKKGVAIKEAGVKKTEGKAPEKPEPEEKEKKSAAPGEKKEKPKHGKKGWEVEGQMDLFSMMEM